MLAAIANPILVSHISDSGVLMTQLAKNSVYSSQVTSLLNRYGFDCDDRSIAELVQSWQQHYPHQWVRLAAIEALYQGRYKAVSVGQILATWQRRGQPIYHFNHEFERLVSRKIPPKTQLPAIAYRPAPSLVVSSVPSEIARSVEENILESDRIDDVNVQNLLPLELSEETEYIPDYIDELRSIDSESTVPNSAETIEDLSKRTIDNFTPTPDRSDVYLKLMALSGDSSQRSLSS